MDLKQKQSQSFLFFYESTGCRYFKHHHDEVPNTVKLAQEQ